MPKRKIPSEFQAARITPVAVDFSQFKMVKANGYDPSMCETIIEIAKQGGHVAHMCLAIGIRSRDTFYRWTKEHEEFGEAFELTKLLHLANLETILIGLANGTINGNFNAIAMLLNNKYPDLYKRATGNSAGTEINIGSINTIEKLTSVELEEKINSLQRKLNYTSHDVIESESREIGTSEASS